MAASVWRGRIAFGMVSIPVRLFKAARRERIRFHHVYRPSVFEQEREDAEPEPEPEPPSPVRGRVREMPTSPVRMEEPEAEPEPEPVARVRQFAATESHDERIQPAQILKGYEIEKDRYVVLEPHEVAALRPRTSTELGISEFVKLDEIDPIYFDVSYYVAPDRGGEKPYAILDQALRKSGFAAVGSLTMHGREHATVIRPGKRGLILHTLFFAKDVRQEEEFAADPQLAGAKEVDLAAQFVKLLAAKFEPEKLKDSYEERLRALIEERKPAAASAQAERGTAAPAAPVIDILEALKKSIEAARKPPGRAAPARAKSRRVR
jgi:DNA end-binding protein Ku